MIDQTILDMLKDMSSHITILNAEEGELALAVSALRIQMDMVLIILKALGILFLGFIATQFWQVVILKKNGKNKK